MKPVMKKNEASRGAMRAELVLPPGAKLVATPRYVSQRTCLATHGIEPRAYLELVVPALRAAGYPVAPVGKQRLARVEDVDAVLLTLAEGSASRAPRRRAPVAPAPANDDGDEIEKILARHGTRRVGGAR